jgi:hypothetical protein
MPMPVDRHPLSFLPALDGGHIAVEVGRDLFPRIQQIIGRPFGRGNTSGRFVHGRSPWYAVFVI